MSAIRNIQSPVGAEIVVEGTRYINFGGSSYLGLSSVPEIIDAGLATLQENGSGYQLPRHYGIATSAHEEVEVETATYFGSKSALYLAAGYYFGLIALAATRERFNTIFYDEFAHYSLREAIAASGLQSYPYRHLCSEDLRAQIKRHLPARARPLIVTDGLYSTLGEIAPLDQLANAIAPYDGLLLVDESHSFGVLGERGRGASEHHQIEDSACLIGGSTSKAFGVFGGILPTTEQEVAAFRATPVGRGASAGLPALARMCARSLRYVREHPELLQRLRENVAYLKAGLRQIGLDVLDNTAPVAAFRAGDGQSMHTLQERLMAEGIFVFHSKYLGAEPAGVIRCGIFADHTTDHMNRLIESLRRLL